MSNNSSASLNSNSNASLDKSSISSGSFKTTDDLNTLDTNGDGALSAQEILDKYDTNGDGLLDTNELASMGKQLSQQLDFNNQLLTHLRSLEGEYHSAQNDLKKQTLALKLALSASTAARTQALEFRKKGGPNFLY